MEARLVAVRPYLVTGAAPGSNPGTAGALLEASVRAARASDSDEHLWLLIVAIAGAFPTATEFDAARRALRSARTSTLTEDLLIAVRPTADRAEPRTELRILSGATVVDAHFSATSRHNTGIQRVTRELSARWAERADVIFAAWTARSGGYRGLDPDELHRLTRWSEAETGASGDTTDATAATPVLLVPIACTVVLPEVTHSEAIDSLAALAQHSGNRVVVIGHDTIPVVSGDTQPNAEIERFTRFLTIVKHADRVIGVSKSAADEFRGFVQALGAQGLTGPSVDAVPLAVQGPRAPTAGVARYRPLVLVVGSQEARKNHFALLYAAERAAAAGAAFTLRFVGGGSALLTRSFDAEVHRLRRSGVDIEVLRGADDAVLVRSYAEARFTCFPSLHEGFGLPVAESLSMGVPCLTTRYGSTAQVAAPGGCIVVDPRDDQDVFSAFSMMLNDDALIARLRQEIRDRPNRTWADYAEEVWESAHSAPPANHSTPVQVDTPDPATTGRAAASARAFAAALAEDRARAQALPARAARGLERPRQLARLFVSQTRETGLRATTAAAAAKIRRVLRAER